MSVETELYFTEEHLNVFREISYDSNPLHTDEIYARKTPFGQRVVYGMCGVLLGISRWSQGRPFKLKTIQAQFKKPIYLAEKYTFTCEEQGDGSVHIKICKGESVHTSISLTYELSSQVPHGNLKNFRPRNIANKNSASFESFEYAPCFEHLSRMKAVYSLEPAQMPIDQLSALLCSSYLVGMEIPGQQALFSDFKFDFSESTSKSDFFSFQQLKVTRDDRFKRMMITGTGTGIRSFQISAFYRPEPVSYDINNISKKLGTSDRFKGKNVLISGASRGFGAVLAKTFALHGATILLNYRSNRNDAVKVRDEIEKIGGKTFLLEGDVGNYEDCAKILEGIRTSGKKIDYLILNASPSIQAKKFQEQTFEEFMLFIEKSMRLNFHPLKVFLSAMLPGSTVMQISSIFVNDPKEQFSHYISAKAATEGLVRALSKEYRNIKFIVTRPPRMLTDQTNLVYDLNTPVSAIDVARDFLESLEKIPSDGNFHEIDIGEALR